MKQYITGLRGLIINTFKFGVSSLRDSLSDRHHSKDFIYARSEYLRSKALILGLVFLVLLPFWTVLDWYMLPIENKNVLYIARGIMLVLLVGLLILSKFSTEQILKSRLAVGAIIATPALFYLFILFYLPPATPLLIGYSFIPYMLIAMLSIFPFTLIESILMGLVLIGLHVYALYIAESLFTLSGLQDLWLLAAILCIAITSNYFQLGLMLRLYREATHDPLTGLLNRGALMRTIEQLQSDTEKKSYAVMMMDLDFFKRINDTYGHIFGDEVLRNFTKTLSGTVSAKDIVARYGGEEFIAILVGTNKDQAMQMAEKIRANTEKSTMDHPEFGKVNYTVSIGLAMLEDGQSFEQAAKKADDRLYEAKQQSRNAVVGF